MNSGQKRLITFILTALVFVCFGTMAVFPGGNADSGSGTPKELVMCYLPNEASEELAEYRGMLQESMGRAIGIKIREINVADYNAVVEAMRTKHADIVYFGPVSYVQAAERSGAEAMVTPTPFGDKSQAGYTSKIIVLRITMQWWKP